ncbi:hypothetical protein [Nocardioides sp. AX2bis]|uniref:hypothetical protein n=1 Tax=Nocardioides sp. AX2bis TaxID=2653157 RepID=UPI00135C6FF6|nr:hypothetical protein [Nocardioides sp. AX2bis]
MERSPVLLPATGAGLSIARGRSTSLSVEDAAVVLRQDGREQVLARPGAVTRVAHDAPDRPGLDPDRSSRLLLRSGDRAVAVVHLDHFTAPAVLLSGDRSLQRSVSGADALAAALDLAVEQADRTDREVLGQAGREVQVRGRLRRTGSRWSYAVLLLGAVLTFLTLPLLGEGPVLGVLAAATGLAVTAWPALAWWRRRRRFLELDEEGPDTDEGGPGATLLSPAPPYDDLFPHTRLLVGPRAVVLHHRGRQTRLAGADLGGVDRLVHDGSSATFLDARRRALLAIDPAFWCPDPTRPERLADACRRAGIGVGRDPVVSSGLVAEPTADPGVIDDDPRFLMPPGERGNGTAVLSTLVAFVVALSVVVGLVGVLGTLPPVTGEPLAVVALVGSGLVLVAALVLLSLVLGVRRRTNRWARPVTAPPTPSRRSS